jgi:hypothetical protein
LSHKAEAEDRASLSDRCATTQSGIFEAEDTRRIAWLALRLSRVRSPGIRPMEKI